MDYICYHASWCPFCRSFIDHYRDLVKGGKERLLDDESDPLWLEMGIELVPTVVGFEDGKEVGRLSAKAGIGLTREMLSDWLGYK